MRLAPLLGQEGTDSPQPNPRRTLPPVTQHTFPISV